ncbi:hypothetical protein ACILE2_00060 [Capnocytophaga canimorsus]|uniref:hypothetical protein n=1 Tax=Capnocytophaga canimorsus TaxID=28188 RepID=UPI0037D25AD3
MKQLFDFKLFVDELWNDSEKREIIEKYEENVELLHGIEYVKDTLFYKEYLSQYNLPKELNFVLKVPKELYYDYDWDLLLRLILASFSSSYSLSLTEQWKQKPVYEIEIMLQITIKKGSEEVTKKLSELWSFQILRLFEIYVEEQMNLATLKKQKEDCEAIESDRQVYIKKFNEQINAINKQINAIVDDYKTNLFLEDFV